MGTITREFYDLQTDPMEGKNLFVLANDNYRVLAQDLEQKLNYWIENTIAAR